MADQPQNPLIKQQPGNEGQDGPRKRPVVLIHSQPVAAHMRPHDPLVTAFKAQGYDVVYATPLNDKMERTAQQYKINQTTRLENAGQDWTADGTVAAEVADKLLHEGNPQHNVTAFRHLAAATEVIYPDLLRLAEEVKPDLIVTEPSAIAAQLVGEKLDVPVITSDNGLVKIVSDLWDPIMKPELNRVRAKLGFDPEAEEGGPTHFKTLLVPTVKRLLLDNVDLPGYVGFQHSNPDSVGKRLPDQVFKDPEKTKVYAMFGSTGSSEPTWAAIFENSNRSAIEAAAQMPDVELFISVGPGNVGKYADLGDVPEDQVGVRAFKARGTDNVYVTAFTNQPEALKQADVAVLHGGYGGLREAVAAETPAVWAPNQTDQPDNADQMVAQGLGALISNPRAMTVEDMKGALEHVIANKEEIKARLHALNEEIQALPTLTDLVGAIHHCIMTGDREFTALKQGPDGPVDDATGTPTPDGPLLLPPGSSGESSAGTPDDDDDTGTTDTAETTDTTDTTSTTDTAETTDTTDTTSTTDTAETTSTTDTTDTTDTTSTTDTAETTSTTDTTDTTDTTSTTNTAETTNTTNTAETTDTTDTTDTTSTTNTTDTTSTTNTAETTDTTQADIDTNEAGAGTTENEAGTSEAEVNAGSDTDLGAAEAEIVEEDQPGSDTAEPEVLETEIVEDDQPGHGSDTAEPEVLEAEIVEDDQPGHGRDTAEPEVLEAEIVEDDQPGHGRDTAEPEVLEAEIVEDDQPGHGRDTAEPEPEAETEVTPNEEVVSEEVIEEATPDPIESPIPNEPVAEEATKDNDPVAEEATKDDDPVDEEATKNDPIAEEATKDNDPVDEEATKNDPVAEEATKDNDPVDEEATKNDPVAEEATKDNDPVDEEATKDNAIAEEVTKDDPPTLAAALANVQAELNPVAEEATEVDPIADDAMAAGEPVAEQPGGGLLDLTELLRLYMEQQATEQQATEQAQRDNQWGIPLSWDPQPPATLVLTAWEEMPRVSMRNDLYDKAVEEDAVEDAEEDAVEEDAVEQDAVEEAEEDAVEQDAVQDAVEEAKEEAVEQDALEDAVEDAVEEAVEQDAVEQDAVEDAVEEAVEQDAVEDAVEQDALEDVVEEAVEQDAVEDAVEEAVEQDAVEEVVDAVEEATSVEPIAPTIPGPTDEPPTSFWRL